MKAFQFNDKNPRRFGIFYENSPQIACFCWCWRSFWKMPVKLVIISTYSVSMCIIPNLLFCHPSHFEHQDLPEPGNDRISHIPFWESRKNIDSKVPLKRFFPAGGPSGWGYLQRRRSRNVATNGHFATWASMRFVEVMGKWSTSGMPLFSFCFFVGELWVSMRACRFWARVVTVAAVGAVAVAVVGDGGVAQTCDVCITYSAWINQISPH